MDGREDINVKSQNFEFLRARRATLADLAGFAERYAFSDPASSLLKQRSFIERMVAVVYDDYQLPSIYSDNLNDLMNATAFQQSVPTVVVQKLHAVRLAGNQAAHPNRPVTTATALDRLYQLFEIAQWFHLRVDGGARSDCPSYSTPVDEALTQAKSRDALEKLKLAEARHEALPKTLDEERAKRAQAEQTAEQSTEALEKLKSEGQKVASLLQFNEETTRHRLIDAMLTEAGWDVGERGASTEQVGQEVSVSPMPSESGNGFADYVLYGDDGRPLAVVEAKRTVKDPRVGAEQARLYAMALEKQTGQRPVIFYTNGMDLYLWDDVQGYPERKVRGFYAKDSLEYLVLQRSERRALATVNPDLAIADRMYQLEAVKRVAERFSNRFRSALLVQATGTGKTRVAVSICDVLIKAKWARRILFLCDRRELRKQADRVFKELLPAEPRVIVGGGRETDRKAHIYLATYPAMMASFEQFDVGFFDLIIADESHRSIYKKFQVLFQYFDALKVGLTATPVRFISRNTYALFGCENNDPTSNYSIEDAVRSTPPYLVPFRVRSLWSDFRKRGIKYADMSDAQRTQFEEQDDGAPQRAYEAADVDRRVFNDDTTRFIWRSLMDEGIREASGTHVGKTIVFARSHEHAMQMHRVFYEMYPQRGSGFCRVIDNQERYAESLIENFKGEDPDVREPVFIAISVDMLDTGIDAPDVVNLVFAKPVQSYVKFWQMIGRGTRLRPNLFGPGKHKTEFLIFDHWANFWFFDHEYTEVEPPRQTSLLERVFTARVELAQASLDAMREGDFQAVVDLLVGDVKALRDTKAIPVKDQWREVEALCDRERVAHFDAALHADLLTVAAPLMENRSIQGEEDAYRFDLLVARLERELVLGGVDGPAFLDLRARVEDQVERLLKNQGPVKAKADAIAKVRSKGFWATATVAALEEIRTELRGVMRYMQEVAPDRVAPLVIDVEDGGFSVETYVPNLEGLEFIEYKKRVEAVLKSHFAENPTLRSIREGRAVKEVELEELAKLVLQVDDRANVRHLVGYQPETRRSLFAVFQALVGLDAAAVERAFTAFVHKHPALSAQQLRFLQMVQNHIAQHGGIEIDRLYEAPFTTLHANGVDGVFPSGTEVDDLIDILSQFSLKDQQVS